MLKFHKFKTRNRERHEKGRSEEKLSHRTAIENRLENYRFENAYMGLFSVEIYAVQLFHIEVNEKNLFRKSKCEKWTTYHLGRVFSIFQWFVWKSMFYKLSICYKSNRCDCRFDANPNATLHSTLLNFYSNSFILFRARLFALLNSAHTYVNHYTEFDVLIAFQVFFPDAS